MIWSTREHGQLQEMLEFFLAHLSEIPSELRTSFSLMQCLERQGLFLKLSQELNLPYEHLYEITCKNGQVYDISWIPRRFLIRRLSTVEQNCCIISAIPGTKSR